MLIAVRIFMKQVITINYQFATIWSFLIHCKFWSDGNIRPHSKIYMGIDVYYLPADYRGA